MLWLFQHVGEIIVDPPGGSGEIRSPLTAEIEGFRDVVACVVMSDGVTQLGLNRH